MRTNLIKGGLPQMNMQEFAVKAARSAAENAYSPYSGIRVGAAVVFENDAVYTGCNVENSSYSATVCAERAAIFKGVEAGARKIKAVAVYSPDVFPVPCGVCLQVMSEFSEGDFEVIVCKGQRAEIFMFSELLPRAFKLEGNN